MASEVLSLEQEAPTLAHEVFTRARDRQIPARTPYNILKPLLWFLWDTDTIAAMGRLLLSLVILSITCSAGIAGQWIAVVAPELRAAIQPLVERRKAEGWEVTLLPPPSGDDLSATLEKIAPLAEIPGPCCLLLVGDFAPDSGGRRVAAGRGTQLRMKEKLTDRPWSISTGKSKRFIETGRLPARTPEEAASMVKKILAWPEQARLAGPFPEARFIVGNHQAPQPFAQMADSVTNSLAQRIAKRLPSAWSLRALVHVNGSPWQGSGEDVPTVAHAMMNSPATILTYMGHSAPEGAVSTRTSLLSVKDWYQLGADVPKTGLFFTCGCHACELLPGTESYGFSAMRAPGGPAAVIGSHGETYAAMGYLALSGMLQTLSADSPVTRVGMLWKGVQEGLTRGEIAPNEFAMLDFADGSGGEVTLDAQRLEHLESWMLLGDPAMPILADIPAIRLTSGAPVAGQSLTITGEVPNALAGAALHVTFERHPGIRRSDLPEVPAKGEARLTASRQRRQMSEEVVLATTDVTASGTSFTINLPLPTELPEAPWTVRVVPVDKSKAAAGVLRLP